MSFNPAMRHFVHAERFAVLGRVMTDPSRWDHKVYKWYTSRGFEVTPVKPDVGDEVLEGNKIVNDVLTLPNLSTTGISIILHPSKSLPILKALYDPSRSNAHPWGVWFQPGAEDEGVREFVKSRGLEERVVLGECILKSGEGLIREEGVKGRGKL